MLRRLVDKPRNGEEPTRGCPPEPVYGKLFRLFLTNHFAMNNKKYTVLTYLMGENYECTHKILEKTPDTDFILVTDNPNYVDENGWDVVCDESLKRYANPFDRVLYVRYHPWQYTDSEVVMRIDASVQVCKDLTPLFEALGDDEIAIHTHPGRNIVFEEIQAWVNGRGMEPDKANKALWVMAQLEGYDVKNYKGLYELSWWVQRHTATQDALNEMAYAMNKYCGDKDGDFRCDQAVFSFVLNKYFNQIPTQAWDVRLLASKFFTWYLHNSEDTYFVDEQKLVKPFLFNKRVMTKRPQDY